MRRKTADGPEQTDMELKVFAKFMERSGLRITPASVVKRAPPEPDNFCEIEGRGGVANARVMSDLAKENISDGSLYWRLDSPRQSGMSVERSGTGATARGTRSTLSFTG